MLKWLLEEFEVPSGKHGTVVVKRIFGKWWLSVDECGMTTPYTHQMWEELMPKAKAHMPARPPRILMLGLAAGGEIGTLNRVFPGCTLTAVEYDPTMVELYERLQLYKPHQKPNIVVADARDAVKQQSGPYELIFVDLFVGPEPAPFVSEPDFLRNVESLLADDGVVVLNANATTRHIVAAAQTLRPIDRWLFKTNHVGLYGKRR